MYIRRTDGDSEGRKHMDVTRKGWLGLKLRELKMEMKREC